MAEAQLTAEELVIGFSSQRAHSTLSDRLCMGFRMNKPATSRVGRPGWPGPGVQTLAKRRSIRDVSEAWHGAACAASWLVISTRMKGSKRRHGGRRAAPSLSAARPGPRERHAV